MPNRQLTDEELGNLFAPLLELVRARLSELSGGDEALRWALRRKLFKELTYDERSKPMQRRALKRKKILEQSGKCAVCSDALPERNSVLDRFEAMKGYTQENTRVICQAWTPRSRLSEATSSTRNQTVIWLGRRYARRDENLRLQGKYYRWR